MHLHGGLDEGRRISNSIIDYLGLVIGVHDDGVFVGRGWLTHYLIAFARLHHDLTLLHLAGLLTLVVVRAVRFTQGVPVVLN